MGRTWLRSLAALALWGVLGSGCGGDDDDDATDRTTTTTAEPALPDEPPLRDDDVSGSGCSPGTGDLPAGWWYGTIEGAPGGDLRFDLACYYVGAAAEAEAASRGDEVNNDYYVVNDNPQIRVVPVAGDATASCVQSGAGVELEDCSPDEVTGDWAVWVRVQAGQVDRIVEQYAP